MTDPYDRRSSDRMYAQLEAARTAGSWMPWAGASLAVLLWGGIGVWLFASVGPGVLFAQSPLLLAGGFAAVLTPGVALILAGIMARESARSSEANAVVLTSARLLLEPAENVRGEVASIAEAVARETQNVNRALTDTRTRLDGLRHEIEASVTAALKAAEIVRADSEVLVQKMSSERQSLTQLAESLRAQSENLAKTIPRHAQMMSEAARAAEQQVRGAEDGMNQRLQAIEETAGRLAQRIQQIDTMGAESRKRAQNLASALMRLDEQLVQSTRMVEAATKAGELATAATKSTAESLRDAVSDALGSALQATETINERSAQAAENAREAMTRLKEAGLQAEATTRAAVLAAKTHVQETEQQVSQISNLMLRASSNAAVAVEGGLERLHHRMEKASLLIGQMKEEPASSTVDDLVLRKAEPDLLEPDLVLEQPAVEAPRQPPPSPKPVASAGLFPPSREPPVRNAPAREPLHREFGRPPLRDVLQRPSAEEDELVLRNIEPPRESPQNDALFGPEPEATAPVTSWRDLLTGIDEAPAPRREQSAGQIIDRLDRAGIRLGVVKASDLRRIATAAHQGDRSRRRAIRDVAPSEIQRVSRLLDTDRDLRTAARTFVTSEERDALRLLSAAERAREDAAPRLSAYLLLDAALGTTL